VERFFGTFICIASKLAAAPDSKMGAERR
jgi:hypothetical protein